MEFQQTFKHALGRLALLWPLFYAVAFANPAAAEIRQYHVAPAPLGSDEGDCSSQSKPCATFQHAADSCPSGGHCIVDVAPGVYSQKTTVFYYKVVSFDGPHNGRGECSDRGAVIVDDRVNGVGQAGFLFWAQDHAVLTIRCMTLKAYASGSTGFISRQFAIGDVVDVNFAQFPSGLGVNATETSKINVQNPGVFGNASRFAMASDLSQITIGGEVTIADKVAFDVAFISSFSGSIVSVYPSAVAGGDTMSGASYECIDSMIRKTVTLPGGDAPYPGNANCGGVVGIKSIIRLALANGKLAFAAAIAMLTVMLAALIVVGGAVYAWMQYRRKANSLSDDSSQLHPDKPLRTAAGAASNFPANAKL